MFFDMRLFKMEDLGAFISPESGSNTGSGDESLKMLFFSSNALGDLLLSKDSILILLKLINGLCEPFFHVFYFYSLIASLSSLSW